MLFSDLDYYIYNYIDELIINKDREIIKKIKKILRQEYVSGLDAYTREMLSLALKKRIVFVVENNMQKNSDSLVERENYEQFLYNYLNLFVKEFYESLDERKFREINNKYNERLLIASYKIDNKKIFLPNGEIILIDNIKVAVEEVLKSKGVTSYKLKEIKYRLKKVAVLAALISGIGSCVLSEENDKNVIEEQSFSEDLKHIDTVSLDTKEINYVKEESNQEDLFLGYESRCPIDIQKTIYSESINNDIPFNVLMTIAHVESDGKFDNNGVISSTDDYGFFQINKFNHQHIEEKLGYTSEDLLYDDSKNIKAAIFLLNEIYDMCGNEKIEDIFGTYNGWKNWSEKEMSVEYVKKCLDLYMNVYNKDECELFFSLSGKREL